MHQRKSVIVKPIIGSLVDFCRKPVVDLGWGVELNWDPWAALLHLEVILRAYLIYQILSCVDMTALLRPPSLIFRTLAIKYSKLI